MNNDVFNLLIVGVGGQGTILASNIVTMAAMNAGLDAKKSEIHGMSQRGGSVFSHVRFGKEVHSPVIPEGKTDVLISLEEMEVARWAPYLHPETKIILLKNRILPANAKEYPEGLIDKIREKCSNFIIIDPEEYAVKLGNSKFLNVFILGVFSNYVDFKDEFWRDAVNAFVPAGTFEKNYEAFLMGQKLK